MGKITVLHWQYPTSIDYFHAPNMYEADRAGEWQEQDMTTLWHQDAYAALTMLARPKLPSVIEIDSGFICSKSIYPSIKRKNKNTLTYENLLNKCKPGESSLYELLAQKMSLNIATNTITIGA